MNMTLTTIGLAIVVMTVIDALLTTMQLGRGGTVSTITARVVWRIVVSLPQWPGKFLQTLAGPAVMTSIIFNWVLGLWIGWFLVLSSQVDAVVKTANSVPADLWDRLYFTGFSVVTLGVGDFSPGTRFAQIITILASMSGFFVFTLAIAYAAPVLNAVVSNRHLAGYITSLGTSGEKILVNAWDGQQFTNLDQHLIELTSQVLLMGRRYLGYPVLHYFHTRDRSMSISLSLGALHDALMLLEHAVAPQVKCKPATIKPLRAAFDALLRGERLQFADPSEDAPPLPNLETLRRAGIPVVDGEIFQRRIEHLRGDRRTLRGFIQRRGWHWEDLDDAEGNEDQI